MKLFNWVQRRLTHKDVSSENAKKHDTDQQFVIEIESLGDHHDVFDNWKGGILTIGTFGYHHLKDENGQDDSSSEEDAFSPEYNQHDDQMTDDDEDDEEVNPLVLAAYTHNYKGLLEMEMEMEMGEKCIMLKDETKKERTTLADLFYADSEEPEKKQPIRKGEAVKEEVNMNGVPFSKKKAASRPMKKLHRLMRRMVRRKIYPELGLNKDNPSNSKFCGMNETTSLLPDLEGAMI